MVAAVRVESALPGRVRVALPQPNDFASADIFVQIIDLDGEVLATSDNLGTQQLPVNPHALTATRSGVSGFETIDVGSVRLRVFYAPVALAGRSLAVTQVARPLASQESLLAGLRLILTGGILLSVMLSAIVGWLLSRAALRPISQIAAVAEDIGRARDFGRRVTYDGPADEVGRLAATFNSMLGQLDSAYSELRSAYARVEAALTSQRRFTADASHELRTPLTTIRGNATLLRQFPDMAPADRDESIAQIADEAGRMSRLVQDLLVLARADAGVQVTLAPTALGPIVRDVHRQSALLSTGVEVELGRVDDVVVPGDRDYLKQLLLILVDNALKYTPAGGKVTLECVRVGAEAELSVADTGIGIDAEDLPHIFDRFYRASRARQPVGTGLGLAIARWIVEVHHGTISVDSASGAGTRFAVRLPETTTSEPAPAA